MKSSEEGCAMTTSPNASYQRDMHYVFKPSSWILGSIGIWPLAIRGLGRHVSKFAIVFCNFALGFAIVPCTLHIIYDEKDLNIRLKLCGLLGFCIMATMKYCVLAIRRPKILRCIEHVKNDWWQVKFSTDRELMLKYAGTGRRLSIISASCMYTAGFIYHTILPFCSEHKINNQTIRPLVYPTYSEFGQTQLSPIYEIVYIAHCMCGYTMYSVTCGLCGLAAIFVSHACGQIEMIAARLVDLPHGVNYQQTSDINQRIATIVKHHVRVLSATGEYPTENQYLLVGVSVVSHGHAQNISMGCIVLLRRTCTHFVINVFATLVDEILQEVCLLEFASSIFTMCLPEYYCIVDWQDSDTVGLTTYFLLFVSFCFNMYILCYIGELLVEKSSQIGLTCFMTDWYQLPAKSVRSLVLVIAISSHPIKLSAGGMIDLSVTTFGNVLKTSLAYLSFLRTLVM